MSTDSRPRRPTTLSTFLKSRNGWLIGRDSLEVLVSTSTEGLRGRLPLLWRYDEAWPRARAPRRRREKVPTRPATWHHPRTPGEPAHGQLQGAGCRVHDAGYRVQGAGRSAPYCRLKLGRKPPAGACAPRRTDAAQKAARPTWITRMVSATVASARVPPQPPGGASKRRGPSSSRALGQPEQAGGLLERWVAA